MPGLVPGIHVLELDARETVDGRDKPGHDEVSCLTELLKFYSRSRIFAAVLSTATPGESSTLSAFTTPSSTSAA